MVDGLRTIGIRRLMGKAYRISSGRDENVLELIMLMNDSSVDILKAIEL